MSVLLASRFGEPAGESRRPRGYVVVYRPGEINRCPGCGRSHWLVGRSLAECAFCATAIAIAGAAV